MHYDSFDAPTAALQIPLSDFLICFPFRCLKPCAFYLEAIFLIQYSATERPTDRISKKQIKCHIILDIIKRLEKIEKIDVKFFSIIVASPGTLKKVISHNCFFFN